MKIVNRGFIRVTPLQPFVDWVNSIEEEFVIDVDIEASIYLIEDDFFDEEPVVKSNFKKIFLNELTAISEDDVLFPDLTFENFTNWFNIELGTAVFDCEKKDLISD